jgi:hypothetical protein
MLKIADFDRGYETRVIVSAIGPPQPSRRAFPAAAIRAAAVRKETAPKPGRPQWW